MRAIFAIFLLFASLHVYGQVSAQIEIEEDIIRVEPPNNGAGPLWCYGSPVIVRLGDRVFASINRTAPGAPLLCNTHPRVFERVDEAWKSILSLETIREREPCPVVASQGRLLLSANPSTEPPGTKYGPCKPTVAIIDPNVPDSNAPLSYQTELPAWNAKPTFTDHSYRGVASDRLAGDALLFHIDAKTSKQHWAHRKANGEWGASGELEFPVRSCYPQVALQKNAAHIMVIGDIVEPVAEWKAFKFEKTQSQWDYVFRRLFYAHTPDIERTEFCEPLELDNVDETAGHIRNLDMWVDDEGAAHCLYTKQIVQSALMRDEFFPKEKLTTSLECVKIQAGEIVKRTTIIEGGEGMETAAPHYARFHSDGKALFVVTCESIINANGKTETVNQLRPVLPTIGEPIRLQLEQPFRMFFTATERGGSSPSPILDLYGIGNDGNVMRYAKVNLVRS